MVTRINTASIVLSQGLGKKKKREFVNDEMMVSRGNIFAPCSEQERGLKTSGGPFQPMLL